MKECALVLDGSRRADGNTAFLLHALIPNTACTVTVGATTEASACQNCGKCKKNGNCVVTDGMDAVYQAALVANKVVLASPIYFGNLTGGLLDVLSRFQCYFKGNFSTLPRIGCKKEGAILLTAGGFGDTTQAERTARLMLRLLNVDAPQIITSYQTDCVAAKDDTAALGQIATLRKRWFGV